MVSTPKKIRRDSTQLRIWKISATSHGHSRDRPYCGQECPEIVVSSRPCHGPRMRFLRGLDTCPLLRRFAPVYCSCTLKCNCARRLALVRALGRPAGGRSAEMAGGSEPPSTPSSARYSPRLACSRQFTAQTSRETASCSASKRRRCQPGDHGEVWFARAG